MRSTSNVLRNCLREIQVVLSRFRPSMVNLKRRLNTWERICDTALAASGSSPRKGCVGSVFPRNIAQPDRQVAIPRLVRKIGDRKR